MQLWSTRKFSPPMGGPLSSSCGGLRPFGPKSDIARRTNRQTTDLRELDGFSKIPGTVFFNSHGSMGYFWQVEHKGSFTKGLPRTELPCNKCFLFCSASTELFRHVASIHEICCFKSKHLPNKFLMFTTKNCTGNWLLTRHYIQSLKMYSVKMVSFEVFYWKWLQTFKVWSCAFHTQ